MSRYLLAAMSALAMSACTDNRPSDTHARDSSSKTGSATNNTTSPTYGSPQDRRGSTTDTTTNEPMDNSSRTGRVAGAGMNNGGTDVAPSTGRTGDASISANHGDQPTSTLTAGDQSESEADRRMTQQIRQAVVADSGLSMKAQNCTIITIGGVVTLRGAVDTAGERQSIARKVDGVAGVRRVDNQLEIQR